MQMFLIEKDTQKTDIKAKVYKKLKHNINKQINFDKYVIIKITDHIKHVRC